MAELEASGLSIAAFARRAGVHPQRLRNWRARLGAESGGTAARFVEVQHHRVAEAIEIVLPSGVMLRVRETVDVGALQQIARALSGDPRC